MRGFTNSPWTGPGWIHEIKYDGYRMMAVRANGSVRLITRNGYDWSTRYPVVVAAVDALWARSCLIDGELVNCDERGLAVFDLLRSGPRVKTDIALFAFDLLELNGDDLRREPIEARKARLTKLLRHSDPHVRHPGRAASNPAMTRYRPAQFNSSTISGRTARPSSRTPASRGHCEQEGGVDLHLGPVGQMDQGQESGCAGSATRARGGLEWPSIGRRRRWRLLRDNLRRPRGRATMPPKWPG